MKTKIEENKSKAKRIKILLKKQKKMIGDYLDMTDFEEPVLMLMRNTRRTNFYEKATQGKFTFEHTDGSTRVIDLSPQYLHTFDYGKKTFKGYICHEDFKNPLPENPVVTSEQFSMAIDKTLHDIKEWNAKELLAKGDMWWKILLGIGVVILAYAFGKMLVPGLFDFGGEKEIVNAGVTATEVVVRNVTRV